MVELIAERGYQAVRILDLTKLARVSRPTFYGLYTDKEELFLDAYDEIAQRTVKTTIEAYQQESTPGARLRAAMSAFAELAAASPEAMSLVVLGAFGAGPKAIERSNRTLEALEQGIRLSRDGGAFADRGRSARKNGSGASQANAAAIRERPHGEGHPRRYPRGDRCAAAPGSRGQSCPSSPMSSPPGLPPTR